MTTDITANPTTTEPATTEPATTEPATAGSTTTALTTAELAEPLGAALVAADEALLDLLADDVVLRASGSSPWSGRYAGKDRVIEYLFANGIAFPNTTCEITDTLISAERVAFLLRLRIERDAHRVEDRSLWTFTVRGGKVVDWELNDLDQYAMDAFFAAFPEHAPGKEAAPAV